MHSLFKKPLKFFHCRDLFFQNLKNINHITKQIEFCNYMPTKVCHNCNSVRYYCTNGTNDASAQIGPEAIDVEAISKGNEEDAHRLKVILLEMEVMRQEGKCVPPNSHLKNQHWEELLKLKSLSGRRKYLEFLFKTFKKKENEQIRKEKAKIERDEKLKERPKVETLEEFVTTFDLQHNNIFLRIYDTTINQVDNSRLIQATMYGQKLVVDCGYDDKMTPRENKNCAKQMMLMFAENRVHRDPYDLHFCNANPNSVALQSLHRYIPTMYEPWFPMNIHQESYLDLFPKQQLVYLTPHCREDLNEYDHDAIYIVGGIVDKVNNDPLSLAKAKKENIRMAKFPLDKYLQWGAGSGKSLTLNQVILILLDLKQTGDWKYALRHVPRRKVVDIDIGSQETMRNDKLGWKNNSRPPSYASNLDNLTFRSRNKSYNQKNKDSYRKAKDKQKRLSDIRSIMFDE